MKILLWIISMVLASSPLLASPTQETRQYTVAITQIVEHTALDQEREGIVAALRSAGYIDGQNLKIIYQNAQGSPITATQIAQKLVSINPDVIVALSTPSAQTALAAIGRGKIPLVFTAVTDPVAARLVKNLSHPGMGVTGVTDYVPPEPQIKLVQKYVPHLKNLGIIYNPGEANSVILLQELQQTATTLGIQVIRAPANRSGEIPAAAHSLVGRVDAIYVPTDNTAVSAISSIVRIGIENKIPVFAGDTGSVRQGAIATAGYDRLDLGTEAGLKVVQLLKGGYSQEIPIKKDHPVKITFNKDAAQKMGLH